MSIFAEYAGHKFQQIPVLPAKFLQISGNSCKFLQFPKFLQLSANFCNFRQISQIFIQISADFLQHSPAHFYKKLHTNFQVNPALQKRVSVINFHHSVNPSHVSARIRQHFYQKSYRKIIQSSSIIGGPIHYHNF